MKQFFSVLLAVLVISTTSSFTPANRPDDKIKTAFEKQFAGAANVEWQKPEKEGASVAFTWGNHRTLAYFNNEGELLGSIRTLFFDQLPLAVARAFYNKFENATIMGVKEINNTEGSQYIISLEKNKRHYHTTIAPSGQVMQTERIKSK